MVVQIISGFRGSGKTTFLNQCIEQVKGKTAVIQNDFGAQVVDRENVEGSLRLYCRDCVGGLYAVRHCDKHNCPLFPYRMGALSTAAEIDGKEYITKKNAQRRKK